MRSKISTSKWWKCNLLGTNCIMHTTRSKGSLYCYTEVIKFPTFRIKEKRFLYILILSILWVNVLYGYANIHALNTPLLDDL